MPSAKKSFVDRIRSLHMSIGIEAVTSKALTEVEHNKVARMLRNGLAVVGFAALEDFIKKKTSEAMGEIGYTSVAFTDLPEKLQQAATYEAISALNYQLSIRDKSEKIEYIQEHALKIASTATANYEMTPHAFAYNQANVNAETIKNILLSFRVRDPWKQMSSLASRLNLTALPLNESYRNASTRRHKAAHVATTDTPQVDISQFVKEAFAIAIGFDCLISKAITNLKKHDLMFINGNKMIDAQQIKIRIIKHVANYWKEFTEGNTRAYRRSSDLAPLQQDAKRRAASLEQVYVEYGLNGLVNDWVCF